MTRMGQRALQVLGDRGDLVPCSSHSVGPVEPVGEPDGRAIHRVAHFPGNSRIIWCSISGYGGNALFGKKCLALPAVASAIARDGWLAEHMLVVESPSGRDILLCAAFPAPAGKTIFVVELEVLEAWTVGDDMRWIKPTDDMNLHRSGGRALGVAPGTNSKSNATVRHMAPEPHVHQRRAPPTRWGCVVGKSPTSSSTGAGQQLKPPPQAYRASQLQRLRAPASRSMRINPASGKAKGIPNGAVDFGGATARHPRLKRGFDWAHRMYSPRPWDRKAAAAAVGLAAMRRDADGDASPLRVQHGQLLSRTGSISDGHVPDPPRSLCRT